jgi:DNA recombination protein RmuC
MDFNLALSALNLLLVVVLIFTVRSNRPAGTNGDLEKQLSAVRDELARNIAQTQQATDARFENFRTSLDSAARAQRDEAAAGRQALQAQLATSLEAVATKINGLTRENADRQIQMQSSMAEHIKRMQEGNEKKLDEMRMTVDEKLQGTLEKRLGESFKLVSENLEQVQRGLGEMKTLANGVGDLQRVLTNVKNRGGWGEAQLASQLEDMLSPEQYEANVKTNPNSNDLVEFAVKLPGRQEGETAYLPIDSKFPQEDYERLLAAQELGNKEAVLAAVKEVEKAIKLQAKTISDKYIYVPNTVDFAVMYLPTEGLFAEVIRIPGLIGELQSKHRVMVTGPTTLMSFLTSIQMGFKTLAIEKSASDVWRILSAAKTEFHKYGQVWDKLAKQLNTAQNTVAEAGRRTRAVEKTLKAVETNAGVEASAEFKAIESLVEDADIVDDELDESDE